MLKSIMSKRFKAISASEISQNPLVMTVFGAIIAIAVVGTIAYLNNRWKANDAEIYATTMNSYLSQEYNKAQSFGNDFYVSTVLDPNGKYIKVNDQNTKLFYKYPITDTFVTATGAKLQEWDTVDMPNDSIKDGQVAIGLFTTSSDLTASNCSGAVNGTDSHYMTEKYATKANQSGKPDICKGYDDTISQVIVAGKPNVIKSIKSNVFKTASNVDDITVKDGGTTALSWLVITLK